MSIKKFSELQQNQQFYMTDALGNRIKDQVWVKIDGIHGEFQGRKERFAYDEKVIPAGQVRKNPGEVDCNIMFRPVATLVQATPEEARQYMANAKAFAKHMRFYGSDGAGGYALIVAEYMAYQDGKTLRDWNAA